MTQISNSLIVLHESKFLRILLDAPNSLAYNIWLPETREMTDEDFKNELTMWLSLAAREHFTKTLVNTLEWRFIISQKLNEWYNQNITPPAVVAGVKKLAFLLPEGIFAQMSIENIFEFGYSKGTMQIGNFKSEVEAIRWLMEQH